MVIVSYSMLFQHFSAPMAYWLMGSTCFSRVIIEPINILQHSRIQLSSTAQTVVTSQNGPRRSEKKQALYIRKLLKEPSGDASTWRHGTLWTPELSVGTCSDIGYYYIIYTFHPPISSSLNYSSCYPHLRL